MTERKKPSSMSYVVGAAQVGSPGLSQIPPQPKAEQQQVGSEEKSKESK